MNLCEIDIKNYIVIDNRLMEITPNVISLSKNLC